jgi:hypothetical protein
MVSNEVADRGACPLEFRLTSQVDDENIHLLLIGTGVCAQSLKPLNMGAECLFEVRTVSRKGLVFIDMIEKVDGKSAETSLVEGFGKCLLDKFGCLFLVHGGPISS